ncbi:MAG: DnaJ domain-containing protein [Caulobacteraceae bacterium]|nr:DnaJ domain-containing protein [Caulobacteraceae bacterium]
MSYLIVGGLIVLLLYSAAGRRALRRYAHWRAATAIAAVGVFAAAGFVGLRGGLIEALLLAVVGAALTGSARWPRPAPAVTMPEAMSAAQARAILGVGDDADADEIRAAYSRLMQRVHPDKGGAPGLAVQLNLARDRLLKG